MDRALVFGTNPPLLPRAIQGSATTFAVPWLPTRPRATRQPGARSIARVALSARGGAVRLAQAKERRQQILKQARGVAKATRAVARKTRPLLLKAVRSLVEGGGGRGVEDCEAAVEELLACSWKGWGREYQALFGMLASRGLWERAYEVMKKVARALDSPDVPTYCAGLRTFAHGAAWELSLAGLGLIRRQHLQPDGSCYSAVLLGLGKAGEWEWALRMMQQAHKEGQLGAEHFESLLAAGKQVVANIDEARGHEIELDIATYTIGLADVERLADSEQVLQVLDGIRNREVYLDSSAYHAAIASCSRGRHEGTVAELLEEAGCADAESRGSFYDTALGACSASGNWEYALHLLNSHPAKSSGSFSHARSACLLGGQWQIVLDLWEQQDGQAAGSAPLGLLEELRGQRLEPTAVAYDALMALSARSFLWEQSVAILEAMRKEQLDPTARSYSTAMSACGEVEHWPKAVALFEDMQRRGPPLNVDACVAFISSLVLAGEWELAVRFLRSMPTWGIEPDVTTYNAVLRVLDSAGQWEWAVRLLEDMKNKGLDPDLDSYNFAISACRQSDQWQWALHLFHEVKKAGLTPNFLTYGLTVAACRRGKQVEWADRLTAEITELSKGDDKAGSQMMAKLVENGVDEDWIASSSSIGGGIGEAAPAVLNEKEENDGDDDDESMVADASDAPSKPQTLVEKYEDAAAMFRFAVENGNYKPWISRDVFDLHQMTVDVATTAVYDMLKNRLSRPKNHRDLMTAVTIITGKGLHSLDGAVIGPAIEEFLKEEVKVRFQLRAQSGAIRIPAVELQRVKALDLFSDG